MRDAAIEAGFVRLRAALANTAAATPDWRNRGWIEDEDEQHAFAIAPPRADAATAAHAAGLPLALSALYALTDGIWASSRERGGEHAFADGDDYLLLVPLAEVQPGPDRTWIIDRHPDSFSWLMIDEAGRISRGDKLRADAVPVAASLADYLGLLADGYGKLG